VIYVDHVRLLVVALGGLLLHQVVISLRAAR